MKNIILIGMPGSGKTNMGKMLAKRLGMNIIDFDDDTIELGLGKKVSEILEELGEEKFLKLEEDLALKLHLTNTILSTSGSLPLSKKAMSYLKKQGKIIYINIPLSTIKTRLERMKVNRIVGMKNMTMDEILKYREIFYDEAYDYKFNTEGLSSKEEVFEDFWKWFSSKNINKK